MNAWSVRSATPDDRDGALRLLERAFGASWVPETAGPVWDWLFQPGAEDGRMYYLVADAGDRLAGQYALLPVRLQHDDRLVRGLLSLHTATDPDFARQGIFTTLAEALYTSASEEAPVVFGFPNPASAPGFYNKLDWVELRPFPLLGAPLPRAGATFTGGLRPAAPFAALGGLLVAARAAAARRVVRPGALTVEPFNEFGSWADVLWEGVAPRLGTCVVRDAAFLNWRFCRSPFRYRRLLLRRGDEPAGFLVSTVAPWKDTQLAYVMELLVRPEDRAGARLLLAHAVGAAVSEGAAGIVAIATRRHPHRRAFISAGMLPLPGRARTSFSFGVRVNGPGAARERLLQIDDWYLSGADLDYL